MYMICPLDLSVQQQHIYTLLYKRSDLNTMIVRYTAEQLALDSDSVLGITEKVARRILAQLKERGYIQELEKGKKGTYTKYRICKEIVINGQETGTYWAPIGQELGTNDKAIPTDAEVDGQELGRKRAPIGQETVSPISNKDKDKEKEKADIADVIAFHSTLKNLPQAKKVTDLRKGHISARIKEYGIEEVKATLVMASESKYLNDSKTTNWYCYDWIYNPTNFAKISEGKYAAKFDSKPKPPCAGIIPASSKPIPLLPKWEGETETTEYFYNPQWGERDDDEDDEVM